MTKQIFMADFDRNSEETGTSTPSSAPTVMDVIKNIPKQLNRDYVRQLYIALCRSNEQEITESDAITSSLLAMILDNKVSPLDRYLAMVTLQKLLPQPGLIEMLASCSVSQLVNCLPLLLSQGSTDTDVQDILKKLIGSLNNVNKDMKSQRHILQFLTRIASSTNSPLSQGDISLILAQSPQWLREIVIFHSTKSSSSNYLKKSSSTLSINELDGALTQDFFTVLNYSQHCTPEQFLNIQVFSMLRTWLLSACSDSFNTTGKKTYLPAHDIVSTDLSSTIREYCLRIIEQCDRKITHADSINFQKACLTEAIAMLDVVCHADSGLVHSVLPMIKRIYEQHTIQVLKYVQAHDVAVLTASVQFFINHSSAVMLKPDTFYPFIFHELLNICYQDSFSAYEIISLIKDNLAQLCYNTSVLEKYFPTILKVLAWNPTTFIEDFLEILPAFVSQQTSVEVFHTLLDLPCLTVALILNSSLEKEQNAQGMSKVDQSISSISNNPNVQSMFQFILRETSGIGDTFDRLRTFHEVIKPMSTHRRVISCSQSVLFLLKCYFSTFLKYADTSTTILLLPALLERVGLIFAVEQYVEQVHSIIAETILNIFSLHPSVVIHCHKELVEYLRHFKNYSVAPHIFIHLVWAVGEYTSINYSELCKPEVIVSCFEGLESTVYEMLGSISSDETFFRLLNVSLSTLAKLATRSQDLIPRAILCLSKAGKQFQSHIGGKSKARRIVTGRINQLLAVLGTPNVASAVLSPSNELETGRYHRDASSMPFILKAITTVLESEEKQF